MGLVPRQEAEWIGAEADAAVEAVREYEAERDGEIEREKEARRRRPSVGVARESSKMKESNGKPVRRRGATVSSGVVPEVGANGKARRRQSSASEVLKSKVGENRVDRPWLMAHDRSLPVRDADVVSRGDRPRLKLERL